MSAPSDQAQRDAAIDPSRSVLVQAPAGSGKTGLLILRFLNCLLTVERPEQVVAITFTRKAAGEIRERVLSALRSAASGVAPDNPWDQTVFNAAHHVIEHDSKLGWGLIANPARLRISTFDVFCAATARRLPLLSGLASSQTTEDSQQLYREAVFALFERIDTAPESLREALATMLDYADSRLEKLLPLLYTLLERRDQWVAGLYHTDLDRVQAELEILVNEQLATALMGLSAQGFDQFYNAVVELSGQSDALEFAAVLPKFDQLDIDHLLPLQAFVEHVTTAKLELLADVSLSAKKGFPKSHDLTAQCKAWVKQAREGDAAELCNQHLKAISLLPSPRLSESHRAHIAQFDQLLINLLAQLNVVFESRGLMDFSEVAFRAISALGALDDGVAIGDALLLEDRVQHIMVDEMQDTSVNQVELLTNLTQAWQPDEGRSLFLCGDLKQSIYLFRGALVELFDDLIQHRRFGNVDLELLQLSANFRSSGELVGWVNTLFGGLFESYVAAEPHKDFPGSVTCHRLQSDDRAARSQAEAERTVALIEHHMKAQPEHTIAVLARSRTSLLPVAQRLQEKGITYAGTKLFKLAQTPPVMHLVALIRALWHPADCTSWAALLRAPFIGLSWDDLWRLRQDPRLLSTVVRSGEWPEIAGEKRLRRFHQCLQASPSPLAEAVAAAWHQLGGPVGLADHQLVDIDKVLELLHVHSPSGVLQDIDAFERALQEVYATPALSNIELMTIHAAKGLEFDTVIVPGLAQPGRNDSKPVFHWRRLQGELLIAPRPRVFDEQDSKSQAEKLFDYVAALHAEDAKAETDRLIYVAFTRAKRHLHLIAGLQEDKVPAKNTMLGRLWPRVESYFSEFDEVEPLEEQEPIIAPLAPRLKQPPRIELRPPLRRQKVNDDDIERVNRQQQHRALEDNIEQRATGLVYHELMAVLAQGADIERLKPAIATRLRHHCHPETGLTESEGLVNALVDKTLGCDHGNWLLANYEVSGAEISLRRKMGDAWQRLIIDRLFVDRDVCWIVDYKTSVAQGALEAFFEDQKQRYAPKMDIYRTAVTSTGIGLEVKTALYFPAHQRLLTL